jgi:dienelactone hydrolase
VTSIKNTIVSVLLMLISLPTLAQFSEPVLKTSQRGVRYQEIVVTAKGVVESCVLFSCSTKEVPIRGLLWLPETGQQTLKLVVYSHGAQGPTPSRPTGIEPDRFGLAGEFFLKGYAVLVAYRKGRVANQLPDSEVSADDFESNSCKADMRPGVRSAVADVKAYLQALSTRRDLDTQSILLMGHSRGGATSLAVAADRYPGVVGVINISGGWITPYAMWGDTGAICNPALNPSFFEEVGKKIAVPVLSLYGGKDPYGDVAHINRNLSFLGKNAPADSLVVEDADHRALLGSARPAWEVKQTRFLKLIGHLP